MEQKLKVELEIKIPDEYVLITKVEYDELQQLKTFGKVWTMKDLEAATTRKQAWLLENLLYVPRFKKELERFVHYPRSSGDKWAFKASAMQKFIDEHFYLIFKKVKK